MSAQRLVQGAEALVARLGTQPISALRDDDVLAVLDHVGRLRRELDALGAAAAHEVTERSLSVRLGERSSADVVVTRTGIEVGEARDWCLVAAATAPRQALSGEPLPPEHPAVAAAVAAGELPMGAAALVVRAVARVRGLVDRARLDEIEGVLVHRAPRLTRRELGIVARRVLDVVDPDGAEPREDLLRARSGLQITRTPDGLVRWIVTMHPEAAGYLTTALDARTAPRRQPRFADDTAADARAIDPEATDETRTLPQRRLDALTDLARESLRHDPGQVAGSPVTMVVTVALDALLSGLGTAGVSGVDEPVSAATARRLACDAEIIPAVLGTSPEPLDLGRSARLHNRAQRRALGVRDRGCVWPGCQAPPGWCEVAHLRSWLDGGSTDLRNGVLLCPFHHRRLDRDGWALEWRGDELCLIPPAHVDARRTPRRAGPVPQLA